jgi:transcriptional antiterminator
MDVENDFIKPIVLSYYNKGLSEPEASKEISKKYWQYGITTRTISKWYKRFKSEDDTPDKNSAASTHMISDEFLIDLVNKNPELNMTGLGKLAGTSASIISIKLREINREGERVKYKHKSRGKPKKFTDEYLIDLSNENPGISIYELSSLAGVSVSVVSRRINQINRFEEKIKLKSRKTRKQSNFTDEFLIDLVNKNPELTMKELGELIGTAESAISLRLSDIKNKEENLDSSYENCKSNMSNEGEKFKTKITKQQVIDLINQNPDLNVAELAKIAKVSARDISDQLKDISIEDMKVNYEYRHGVKKISDDLACSSVNCNSDFNMEELPELRDISAKSLSTGLNRINLNGKVDSCGEKKKVQKTLIYFSNEFLIDLVNNNPDLNMTELAILAGTTASTISVRLREINSDGEKVKYKHKSRGKPKIFTDELLISLAKENPGITIVELSSLIGASASAVSRRINKINSTEEKIKIKSKKSKIQSNFTDEFLTNLVNESPDLTMQELGRLIGVAASTISARLRKIKSKGEALNYSYKNCKYGMFDEDHPKIRLSKQHVIDLINENPKLNISELANIANVSVRALSDQLKNINADSGEGCCSKKVAQKYPDDLIINLVNNNPDFTMAQIGKLAGTTSSIISTRLREINSTGERVKYKYKTTGKPKKISDEFLISLAEENPNISIKELSSLSGASISVVSNRIKRINICGERIKISSGKTGKKSNFTDEFLINLVNENPELTMQKLGELVGVTASTISLRLRKIKCKGEMLNYSYKNCKHGISDEGHPKTRLSKQRVIDLINENPKLNMAELAKLANVSTGTISNHIKKLISEIWV